MWVTQIETEKHGPEMTETPVDLPPVSVIIAAYNEQAFIETTVASIVNGGFPCEVVVVDDGSTDQTPVILERLGGTIKVVTHQFNRGKGAAMASGLEVAAGDIVVFCDAHLLGLRKDHLVSMVLPLVRGSARAVLGADTDRIPRAPRVVAPWVILTGQRAYHKADLMPFVSEMEGLGYGAESFLFTKFAWKETAPVLLPGLIHLTKRSTSAPHAAALGYLRESVEILETLGKVQGLVPAEAIELRQRFSALLAKYTGTREQAPRGRFAEPVRSGAHDSLDESGEIRRNLTVD